MRARFAYRESAGGRKCDLATTALTAQTGLVLMGSALLVGQCFKWVILPRHLLPSYTSGNGVIAVLSSREVRCWRKTRPVAGVVWRARSSHKRKSAHLGKSWQSVRFRIATPPTFRDPRDEIASEDAQPAEDDPGGGPWLEHSRPKQQNRGYEQQVKWPRVAAMNPSAPLRVQDAGRAHPCECSNPNDRSQRQRSNCGDDDRGLGQPPNQKVASKTRRPIVLRPIWNPRITHSTIGLAESAGRRRCRRSNRRSSRRAWASVERRTPCNHRTTGRRPLAWSPSRSGRTLGR